MGALNDSETTLKIGKMLGCFENPFANDTIYSGEASFVRLLLGRLEKRETGIRNRNGNRNRKRNRNREEPEWEEKPI